MIIDNLPKGYDISDSTAVAADILINEIGYNKDGQVIGTMPDKRDWTVTIEPTSQVQTIAIPKGYYDGNLFYVAQKGKELKDMGVFCRDDHSYSSSNFNKNAIQNFANQYLMLSLYVDATGKGSKIYAYSYNTSLTKTLLADLYNQSAPRPHIRSLDTVSLFHEINGTSNTPYDIHLTKLARVSSPGENIDSAGDGYFSYGSLLDSSGSINGKILFVGGRTSTYANPLWIVDEYLTTNFTNNGIGNRWLNSVSISTEDYVLFAGGSVSQSTQYNTKYDYYSTVFSYNRELTKSTTSKSLSRDCAGGRAAKVGNYVLFAGGAGNNTSYNLIDVYDSSLTKGNAIQLSLSPNSGTALVSFELSGKAYFMGRTSESNNFTNSFNSSLTRENIDIGYTYASSLASADSLNNHVLVGGIANIYGIINRYDYL